MEIWKSYKLRNVCSKIGSGATPKGGKGSYQTDGISLIRSQNVLDFDFSTAGLAFIDEAQAQQLANVVVEEGDVLLNITGDSVARVCQVPASILPARVNQHVAILRANRKLLLPEFLKYYLLNPAFKNFMLGLAASGATRNALTKTMIEEFEIIAPESIAEQRRIAAILSALDDKIELNRRMNATLEAMARALFQAWFVAFEPVHANSERRATASASPAVAQLFPAEFDNGLPKGWEIKKLGEVLEAKGGTTPSTKEPQFWNGSNYWATPKDLSNLQFPILLTTERKITNEGVRQISSGILPKGTLLLSSRAPVGYLAISQVPVSINQGFIGIQGKTFSNLFLLYWLTENMETVKSRATGSTFQEINKANFREIEITVPNTEALKAFDNVVGSNFERMVANERENQRLAQIRDGLLPRLMSGQIRVGAAEKML